MSNNIAHPVVMLAGCGILISGGIVAPKASLDAKASGLFCVHRTSATGKDDDQILGWKSYKFIYGAETSMIEESEAKELARQRDCVCKQSACGCGCYVATCDVDKLDQQ